MKYKGTIRKMGTCSFFSTPSVPKKLRQRQNIFPRIVKKNHDDKLSGGGFPLVNVCLYFDRMFTNIIRILCHCCSKLEKSEYIFMPIFSLSSYSVFSETKRLSSFQRFYVSRSSILTSLPLYTFPNQWLLSRPHSLAPAFENWHIFPITTLKIYLR